MNFKKLQSAFENSMYSMYSNNFSIQGKRALSKIMTNYEKETNSQYTTIDIIKLCCNFTEYTKREASEILKCKTSEVFSKAREDGILFGRVGRGGIILSNV